MSLKVLIAIWVSVRSKWVQTNRTRATPSSKQTLGLGLDPHVIIVVYWTSPTLLPHSSQPWPPCPCRWSCSVHEPSTRKTLAATTNPDLLFPSLLPLLLSLLLKKAITELLYYIGVIKLQVWEETFGNKIYKLREEELGWSAKSCTSCVLSPSCSGAALSPGLVTALALTATGEPVQLGKALASRF